MIRYIWKKCRGIKTESEPESVELCHVIAVKEQMDTLHATYYKTLTSDALLNMKLHESQLQLVELQTKIARRDLNNSEIDMSIKQLEREKLQLECRKLKSELSR